jgi:hypothetical protein
MTLRPDDRDTTPETSVNFHQFTWRNIPEDSYLRLYLRMLNNLTSHVHKSANFFTCQIKPRDLLSFLVSLTTYVLAVMFLQRGMTLRL